MPTSSQRHGPHLEARGISSGSDSAHCEDDITRFGWILRGGSSLTRASISACQCLRGALKGHCAALDHDAPTTSWQR